MKSLPCPIKPPIEFGKPLPKDCPGKVYLYGEGPDAYERCDTCGATWTRDSKETTPHLEAV